MSTHALRRTTLRIPLSHHTMRPSHVPRRAIPFSITPTQNLHSTSPARSSDSHESQYEPPTGWLWGIPPGQKYEKEGWENIWYYGFFGSLGAATVAYAFKPDTSIETWALEEATRRLQREGVIPDEEEGS